jgi:hypothetical protein
MLQARTDRARLKFMDRKLKRNSMVTSFLHYDSLLSCKVLEHSVKLSIFCLCIEIKKLQETALSDDLPLIFIFMFFQLLYYHDGNTI